MNSSIAHGHVRSSPGPSGSTQKYPGDIAAKGKIIPLVILWITALLPPQVRTTIGIEIFSYRICFIVFIPFIISEFASGRVKRCTADFLMGGGATWMIIAMIYHEGIASGIVSSLSVASDIAAGYLLARACIRSIDDLRRALIIMAVPFLIAGSLVMAESITHQLIIIPIVAQYFSAYDSGVTGSNLMDYATRFGLFRGTGAFPHPILAGLCLSSLIPLYALAHIRSWPKLVGRMSSYLAFFSVSSTAFLGMAIALLLLAYNRINKVIPAISWKFLVILASATGAVLQVFSGGGILGIIARLSLDAQTGYYRYLLYIYGTKALASHPFLGVGKNPFELPPWMKSGSIDSYWLLLSLRFGYPSSAMIMIGCINIIYNLFKLNKITNLSNKDTCIGLSISIIIFIIGGFSVALFSGSQIWFALLLGTAASIYSVSDARSNVADN